jgi:four helix bundle protein
VQTTLADFIFYQKFNDFIGYFFPIVERFPHREKFALCCQVKNHCYVIMQNIIDAHRARSKYTVLYKIDGQLEFLRWLIRHAHDRGYLAHHSFETSAKLVDELGRILGRLLNPVPKESAGSRLSAETG